MMIKKGVLKMARKKRIWSKPNHKQNFLWNARHRKTDVGWR